MSISPIGSNQTELSLPDGSRVLFSYKTPVAAYVIGRGYIRTEERFGPTTSKHINNWMGKGVGKEVPQGEIEEIATGMRKPKPASVSSTRVMKVPHE
jgi:hypothetical protein